MKNIKKIYSPLIRHLLQAQQALAYAKVAGGPGTGSYPAPSPSYPAPSPSPIPQYKEPSTTKFRSLCTLCVHDRRIKCYITSYTYNSRVAFYHSTGFQIETSFKDQCIRVAYTVTLTNTLTSHASHCVYPSMTVRKMNILFLNTVDHSMCARL